MLYPTIPSKQATFLTCSRGLSISISFNKPMIVTNVGGLPELVIDRRFVVAPGDPEALAKAVIGCFKDPLRLVEMADGAGIVAEKMAWPSIAKKTWSIYRKALGLAPTTQGL